MNFIAQVKRIVAGTSRPPRDPARLAALPNERFAAIAEEGLDTGYGFDALRLGATQVESAEDAPLQGDRANAGHEAHPFPF